MSEPPTAAPRAFDERRVAHRLVVVPEDEVIDLLHVTHASERIAEYAQAMREGARFPPIAVVRLFGRVLVADGHKRLAAARACGLRELPVEVWPWRRWFADQCEQAARQARKHLDILLLLPRRPREAAALAGSTFQHWWRVARSLAARVPPR
jgi:hypothetical protein